MRSHIRPFLAALLAVVTVVPVSGWAQQVVAPNARAPARTVGADLLFKGDDFTQTDVRQAT